MPLTTSLGTGLTLLAERFRSGDAERGDAPGWASLAGVASVGVAALGVRYQELLVQAMATALDVLPGV